MAQSSSDSSDTKDKVAEFIAAEMTRYETFHSDRFEKAKSIYQDWLNTPPPKDQSWSNAVHVPLTFEGEQTIAPRLHSALFPTEAPVEMAVFGETPEEQGIIIRDLIRHHFRITNIQDRSLLAISQATLLGTGYTYLPWTYKTGYLVDKASGQRYLAVTDNRPDSESVSFFEIFPHPAKLDIGDGLPIIRQRFCDAEYLKRLSKMPQFNFKNLQAAIDSECPSTGKYQIVDDRGANFKKREKYEILEYWGPWDEEYKNDKGDTTTRMAVPYWIMVINRQVTIRCIANPYNHQTEPFTRIKLYEDINPSWFGIGTGQIGKPCQERCNKVVNQRLDNVDLVLNKQGFYNGNDPLINIKQLEISRPGKWHQCSNTVDSIRWMDTPDVTASAYKEEEIAKADYREATGAVVPLMPNEVGEQHSTSSGINLLQGAAGIRFRPIVRRMENDLIGRTSYVYLSNLQQFMSSPEWIKVVSKDGKTTPFEVSPKDIQAKVKFIPTGLSEVMNKEMLIGQLLRFKELTQNDPTVNRAYINKKIAELMGLKDIQDIIIEQKPAMMGPGQLPPDIQQYVKQRMAEGASPDQIKLELLGQPPAPGQEGGGGTPMSNSAMSEPAMAG